jgi:hypothetical protein
MGPRIQPFDPWLGFLVFAAVTAILIGVAIIQRLRADLLGGESKPEDILAAMQQAHDAGELDDEEFKRVCESIDHSATMTGDPEAPRSPLG